MSIFLLGMGCATASGRTIYVDDDGPADFNNIQAAIDDSNDGDTIIVADGIYTGEGNRDIEFSHGLPEGQTRAITVHSANGPENCIIDCNGSESDPHRGFIFQSGEDANSVINGFTITNGYAPIKPMPPPWDNPVVLGGGIYCRHSSPTINNCIFRGNSAAHSWSGVICCGGGMYSKSSSVIVSNCIFSGNLASGDFSGSGGGMHSEGGGPTVTNCIFSGNFASHHGGGMYSWAGSPTLSNCILWDDSPEEIYVYDSTPVITYSDVQGTWPGKGNINTDPCFADPSKDDYHLKSQAGRWDANEGRWTKDDVTSPCIDAGDPVSPIGLEPFPNGGRVNMGAYGGTLEASKSYFVGPVCETIFAGDINGDCKVNFKDFALMALHWLEER